MLTCHVESLIFIVDKKAFQANQKYTYKFKAGSRVCKFG